MSVPQAVNGSVVRTCPILTCVRVEYVSPHSIIWGLRSCCKVKHSALPDTCRKRIECLMFCKSTLSIIWPRLPLYFSDGDDDEGRIPALYFCGRRGGGEGFNEGLLSLLVLFFCVQYVIMLLEIYTRVAGGTRFAFLLEISMISVCREDNGCPAQ